MRLTFLPLRGGLKGRIPGRGIARSSRRLHQGRHARLLAAGKANGQRLHRSFQRPVQGGVPECSLVPNACRHGQKVGGLAQILQRGAPTWRAIGHKGTDLVDQSRWRHQPAVVKQPGKSDGIGSETAKALIATGLTVQWKVTLSTTVLSRRHHSYSAPKWCYLQRMLSQKSFSAQYQV